MRAVLAITIFALLGAQVVSAGMMPGLIYQQTYAADYINHPENFFCNGTPNPVSSYANFTAGECNNGDNGATSFAYYCDTDAVIFIAYSGANCDAASATSMQRVPTVCGAGSTSSKWVCSGKDTLPNGWSFPPLGQWAVSSTQFNNTYDGTYSSPSAGACGTLPPSARAVTSQAASYSGCRNIAATTYTQKSSSQSFHGGFGATYIDFDCKAENLQTLSQGFAIGTCTNGVTGSGITGGPDAPTAPINYASGSIKASRTYYSKTGDSNFCGTKLATTYYANTCLNGYKVECVNGDAYTESMYILTDGGNGACSGSYSSGYPLVQNTSSAACVQNSNTDYGFSYSCSTYSPSTSSTGGSASSTSSQQSSSGNNNSSSTGSPIESSSSTGGGLDGSASTASFSIMSLVIAAIVALFSQ